MMRLNISVIICTKNRFDDFRNIAASLMLQKLLPDEFVVVDSSDTRDLVGYLKSAKLPFPVKYIHSKPGLTLQRNIGVRRSEGDLLFFFDDDVDSDSDYIRQVEQVFFKDTRYEVGAVGGRILNPLKNQPPSFQAWIGNTKHNFLVFMFGLVRNGDGRFRYSGMPTHPDGKKKNGYIECLSGCCMAFRREALEKIEFDETLPNYGLMEDVNISKRTLDIGYRIYYETSAALVHKESPKNRLSRYLWTEMAVTNYAYLFHKDWNRNWLRKTAYYWAFLGLIVINFTKKQGLQGTLNGIEKLRQGH